MNYCKITFAFILAIFIYGCSSESNNLEPTESELIAELTKFNNGLLESIDPETRGFWRGLLKVCAVVGADVAGAYEGGKIGGIMGGWAGPTGAIVGAGIGGLVLGAGGSYVAYVSCSEMAISVDDVVSENVYNDPLIFYRASLAIELNSKEAPMVDLSDTPLTRLNGQITNIEEDINVYVPDDFENSLAIAQLHNETLAMVMSGETFADVEVPEEIMDAFTSDDFISTYQSMLDNVSKSIKEISAIDMDKFFDNMGEELYDQLSRSILTLFYEIYTQYPQKMEDIDFIVNYYIQMLCESNELNQSEKEALVSALTVAAYSPRFWLDYFDLSEL